MHNVDNCGAQVPWRSLNPEWEENPIGTTLGGGCLCPAVGPRDWQALWPARPPHFTESDGLKQRGDALVLPGGARCEVVTHSSPLGLSFQAAPQGEGLCGARDRFGVKAGARLQAPAHSLDPAGLSLSLIQEGGRGRQGGGIAGEEDLLPRLWACGWGGRAGVSEDVLG